VAADRLSAFVWVIGIWNLEFVWYLVLGAWNFSLTRAQLPLKTRITQSQNFLELGIRSNLFFGQQYTNIITVM
jgi:hypothetical protein